jgi:L-threonylcarbamoyladenylate synthase
MRCSYIKRNFLDWLYFWSSGEVWAVRTTRLSFQLQQQIDKAADIVKAGGVVAFPTDTVYGLGANPFIPEAVDRIYKIKQRLRRLPLPILLADESQLDTIAASVPEIARLLMKRFWPGGLTIVLHKAAAFPGSGAAEEDTIAVRVPNHPITLALIKLAAVPVIGTSANLSSQPSALTAGDVEYQLDGAIDLVIDGGKCPGGVESTVVDITGKAPVILRKGAVPEEEINKAFKEYMMEVDKRAYCSRQ